MEQNLGERRRSPRTKTIKQKLILKRKEHLNNRNISPRTRLSIEEHCCFSQTDDVPTPSSFKPPLL